MSSRWTSSFARFAQRVHEKLGIESDGKVSAPINYRQSFPRLAHLGRVGRNVQVVSGKIQANRARLVIAEQGHATHGIEKRLALDGDAFLGLAGNNLPVVRIVPSPSFETSCEPFNSKETRFSPTEICTSPSSPSKR